MADFRGESQHLPVINLDAFELRGNAQDFNENSGAGSSDQLATKPVSPLGWGYKELGGAQTTPAKGSQSRVIFKGHW